MKSRYLLLTILIISLVSFACDLNVLEQKAVKVTFITDEVLEVKTVSVGSKVSQPSAPRRTGYSFDAWYTEDTFENRYDFSQEVTQNLLLYAKWIPNQYTITFQYNSSQANENTTASYDSLINAPRAPDANGTKIFSGWYKNDTYQYRWDFSNDVVRGNTTLYALWLIDPVSVSFDTQGGSYLGGYSIEKGSLLSTPSEPTKEGYVFVGWYSDNSYQNRWNFASDVITQDCILFAKWDPKFASNISPYRAALLSDVPLDNPDDPPTLEQMDAALIAAIQGSFQESLKGTIASVQYLLSDQAQFQARSLSALFRLKVVDEAFAVVKDDTDILSGTVDFLDLEMAASTSKFLEVLEVLSSVDAENPLDYSAFRDILMSGRIGLSTFAHIEDSVALSDTNTIPIDLATGAFLDFGIQNATYREPTADNPIPMEGDVYLDLAYSYATNCVFNGSEVVRAPVLLEIKIKPIAGAHLSQLAPVWDGPSGDLDQTFFETVCSALWDSPYDDSTPYLTLSITTAENVLHVVNLPALQAIGMLFTPPDEP